jgi:HK97 family phage prohead protease
MKEKRISKDCLEHNCDLCTFNDRDICGVDAHFEGINRDITDKNFELRTFDITELRVEQREDKKPVIKGYAIVFNKLSEDLGGFREQVAPGSCTRAIKEDNIVAAFNHDPNFVLGRNKAGTLQLSEDEKGVHYTIDPVPDFEWCRNLLWNIEKGNINQCSFKFAVTKDAWENKKDGSIIRTLEDIKLYDISIVTYPAYPQTTAKVRDYINALSGTKEELDVQGALKGRVDSLVIDKRILNITEKLI